MLGKHRAGVLALLAVAVALCTSNCSGGGSSPSQPTLRGDPAVLVNPTSLSFTAVGQTQTFSAQEGAYTNDFTATSSATGVATVAPSPSYGSFTVTAVAAGTATITVKDVNGNSATVSVGVTTTTGTIN
jgi:uncharacterized protein YjdB